jgi:hypothetical protein
MERRELNGTPMSAEGFEGEERSMVHDSIKVRDRLLSGECHTGGEREYRRASHSGPGTSRMVQSVQRSPRHFADLSLPAVALTDPIPHPHPREK